MTHEAVALPRRLVAWLRASAPQRRVDEEQFAYDLSLMLRSGLRLLEALHTLRDRESATSAPWLAVVLQMLEQGQSRPDRCSRQPSSARRCWPAFAPVR